MKKIIYPITLISSLLSTSVSAGIIFEQDIFPLVNGANFSQSGGTFLADDFLLTESATISALTVFGSYWSSGVQPASSIFNLTIGTTLGGNDILNTTLTASSVLDTGYNHNNNGSADILGITFDVSDFAINSGTYYFSAISLNSPSGTNWAWQRSNNTGSSFFNNSSWAYGDLAFSISGQTAEVPAPASFVLMALGLVGIGFSRKKKNV